MAGAPPGQRASAPGPAVDGGGLTSREHEVRRMVAEGLTVLRILRPGGRLVDLEHVCADDARLARRQDRLAPCRLLASGCRCNRRTLEVLGAAFELEPPTRPTWWGMPSIVHPLVSGAAVVPAGSRVAASGTADAGRRAADGLTEVRA